MIWIGLQVALFACFASVLAILILKKIPWRELVALSAGWVAGLTSMLGFLHYKGVLSYFLPVVAGWLGKRYAHTPHIPWATGLKKILTDTF